MEFGVVLQPNPPATGVVAMMKRAEAAGFGYGWTFDSHVLWQETFVIYPPILAETSTMIVGPMVTKTLVIMGDPISTSVPGRARGAMLRAYDKANGQQVGAVLMPAQQSGNPMTYMVDGKQYIVVAVSGGSYSGEYLAFRLPD